MKATVIVGAALVVVTAAATLMVVPLAEQRIEVLGGLWKREIAWRGCGVGSWGPA